MLADALVVVEIGRDPVRAAGVGAFADELRLIGVQVLGGPRDRLVHLAEHPLGARDPFFVAHLASRSIRRNNARGRQ